MNFADTSVCKRCGANLKEPAGSPALSPLDRPLSKRSASTLFYFEAAGAGLLIWISFFIYALLRWPHYPGESPFPVLGLIYAAIGFWYGYRRRSREWLVALCLSATYLLIAAYSLYGIYRYNHIYGYWFWVPKFFLSPFVLYLSVPMAAFLGARFGSRRSLLRLAPILPLFLVIAFAIGYARGGPSPPREISYSSDFGASPPGELVFRLDIKLRVQTTDEPMRFRKVAMAGGTSEGGMNVTVIRKDATFAPTTQMFVRVDGKQMENTMWPVNSPDGSSRIDYSQKQDYSHIIKWKIGPNGDFLNSLVNAHHIEMTWGNANFVLPDEQVAALRNFARSWGRILKEEGLLCTNPMCVQGSLNPKR